MIDQTVHVLHTGTLLACVAYPVVSAVRGTANDTLDAACVCTFIAIAAQWALIRNECIVHVLDKQRVDPAYRAGDCPCLQMNPALSFTSPAPLLFGAILIVLCRWRSRWWAPAAVTIAVLYKVAMLRCRFAVRTPYCQSMAHRMLANRDRFWKF